MGRLLLVAAVAEWVLVARVTTAEGVTLGPARPGKHHGDADAGGSQRSEQPEQGDATRATAGAAAENALDDPDRLAAALLVWAELMEVWAVVWVGREWDPSKWAPLRMET